eukprot:COSAG06_NODE_6605_length_2858_cov_1.846321_2_plen_114_part_00
MLKRLSEHLIRCRLMQANYGWANVAQQTESAVRIRAVTSSQEITTLDIISGTTSFALRSVPTEIVAFLGCYLEPVFVHFHTEPWRGVHVVVHTGPLWLPRKHDGVARILRPVL